ncbi:MAG: hypothetical protein A3C53_02330 [Omnitrophica WOR_2 bacterium RIFCSPHIGHO2_02_FULL_68_15]|nr:MAG: hypothetical protein A3C53_02330 [Omnitrophica WOR_2 bacterium RIFCSPHIGHO2_02_FULL_68_15]
MTDGDRLQQLLDRIDRLNAEDPSRDVVEGTPQPRELIYAKRLTGWVLRLNPKASEALRIAARGQHVRRWTVPRSRYPMNRAGYLRWRETLKAFHADTIAGLMREEGYPDDAIQRVRTLMGKRQLGTDPETQTLEDALCLVFLETQFADLRRKTSEEQMRQIVRKTWGKMSERARAEALTLPWSDADRRYVEHAVVGH